MRKHQFIGLISLLTCMLVGSVFFGAYANAQGPSSEMPDGYILIEGDILVRAESDGIGIQSTFGDINFWPNGIVPYQFDTNVTTINQTRMIASMLEWENVANIDFRPRNEEANYIHIQNSTGNNSAVGMQGGKQVINIFNWNSRFTIVHELGHTLGLWHEQSRPDRNNYIRINLGNIQNGQSGQFSIRQAADVYSKGAYGLSDEETYDFDSIMHYDQCAFSKACPIGSSCNCGITTTITVLPPNQSWQSRIGQLNHLSKLDNLTMSFLYPENGWRFVDRTHTGSQNGTFLEPYNNFNSGVNNSPNGSILWIQPGTYPAAGTYDKPMSLQAPLGHVTLSP
ncbi:MAG: M12 family metallopeptidase [Anaerolineae bacterium]|nr:M12 family metallopeptidase [Anaerolineae bacterium]